MVHGWEYCIVHVTYYRDGADPSPEPRELLALTLPGSARTSVTHALGSLGLLNQLGSEGWELVQITAGGTYMKRRKT